MDFPKEKEELYVFWTVKNVSYCYENIRSADFTYSGEQWCLCFQLHPEYVECRIVPLNPNSERSLKAKIAILTWDSQKKESHPHTTCLRVSRDIIFGRMRNSFLQDDALTILCQPSEYYVKMSEYPRVWKIYYRINEMGTRYVWMHSKIGVKSKNFHLKIFTHQRCNQKLYLESSDQYGEIHLNLKSVCDGINSYKKNVCIEISRTGGEKSYSVLKVTVLDPFRKILNCISDEFVFEKDRQQFWRFPTIIRDIESLTWIHPLLFDSMLIIKCEFSITLGKVSEERADYGHDEEFEPLRKKHLQMHLIKDRCLTTDLKRILNNGTFSDVNLQVGSDVIQAHKNILSARSPVFEAMFSKNMKEAISNTVVIEDLDVATVHSLLLYMYTDTISDTNWEHFMIFCGDEWENIMNLYFAADKYEVLRLKQICSSFLQANLSHLNVCKLLVLADLHQDADLRSKALAFFSGNFTAISSSEAWTELCRNNSSFAMQIVGEISSSTEVF